MLTTAAATSDLRHFSDSIADRGWAITDTVLDTEAVLSLREAVAPHAVAGRGGARNLLTDEQIRSLAVSPVIRAFAEAVLGEECFAVRALLFDKTPAANWKVIWHQDLTIATRARCESPGFGPWTDKGGVPHVQPPVEFLESMLAVRVHLDACTATNGPVRVLERSHQLGRLSGHAIDELRHTGTERECLVEQGAILAFRPLIVHASAPAVEPGHRRVIHLEYANSALPFPLAWNERVHSIPFP